MERRCNELKLGSQHDQRVLTRVRGKRQRRELYKMKTEARAAVPHARECEITSSCRRAGRKTWELRKADASYYKRKVFPGRLPFRSAMGYANTLSLAAHSAELGRHS